ncbi:putative bifunctional diguanylate cyclase/phosphodiesterase [Angustibacter sp. McL0619]|uniref:putative bifunctional diguanylate cyclase/phosphodiesterase n=1 Tax=Angustibacter sp. McL0619 TaxID=3415676 RepID=UPI003CF1BBC4
MKRPSPLALYVGAVAATGAVIMLITLRGVDLADVLRTAPTPVWLLAVGLVLGELTPIPVARGDDETSDVTMSTTFALALVATGPFALLLLLHSVAVAADDVRTRRSPVKMAFNFGQYAISLLAARIAYCAITGHDFFGSYNNFEAHDLPAALVAGFTFIMLNNGLVAIVVAMATRQPVLSMLRDDLAFKLETSSVLLGLAPVAAVLAEVSGWLVPLLALPVLAVRRSAALAVARQSQAMRDALTGLGNREYFFNRAERVLALCQRNHQSFAVLMIDLDHFKDINDTLGHQIGDRVIQTVGRRIMHAGGIAGCVARLGGDEFAVALPSLDAEQAGLVAEGLLADIVRPLQVGGTRMVTQASVGIAMAEPGLDVTMLMQRADIALYEAKRDRARWCLFDPAVTPSTPERLGLLADLRDALDRRQISVHFQPQVALVGGRIFGAEALARWDHPTRGSVAPEEFIALAEHAGLIDQVTDIVLEESLAALACWGSMGLAARVSVNLSARQLADMSLPERMHTALARHNVLPGQLTAEVTEGSIMGDPRRAAQVLQELRTTGIRIAVDDFGTGYSSLAYLQRLDLDELKIDRSFVQSMNTVSRDDVLVRSIIELAHNLGLSVVAEGVESAEQVERLRELQCDAAQGYHLGRPMDREMMTAWLRRDTMLEPVRLPESEPSPETLTGVVSALAELAPGEESQPPRQPVRPASRQALRASRTAQSGAPQLHSVPTGAGSATPA